MSGAPIHHVFVGVSGNHIESFDSKGVIAISHAGSEIIEDDINRVLEAAQAVSLPSLPATAASSASFQKAFAWMIRRGSRIPLA